MELAVEDLGEGLGLTFSPSLQPQGIQKTDIKCHVCTSQSMMTHTFSCCTNHTPALFIMRFISAF